MADSNGANGNGEQRVTNALILKEIEHMKCDIGRRLDNIEKSIEAHNLEIQKVKLDTAAREERLKGVEADCIVLTNRVNAWNGMNSLGVIAAGIMALFVK